jgi:hypothetical protein
MALLRDRGSKGLTFQGYLMHVMSQVWSQSIDSQIPRDLETIVLKSIEKDPNARYQSA